MSFKVFWLRCGRKHGNFGDKLTPLLLDYLNIRYSWAPPESSDLIGIGSLCEKIPADYSGAVWTSGNLYASHVSQLLRADVLALRGRLTAQQANLANKNTVCLGDGGLLCHLLAPATTKRYKIGIIPHYVDAKDPVIARLTEMHADIRFIDICDEPRKVLRQTAQCQHILSSSLHGLILADSLGIPNRWLQSSSRVLGEGFKFRDYYSVYAIDCPTPVTLTADDRVETLLDKIGAYARPGITAIQDQLLQKLGEFLGLNSSATWGTLSSPCGIRGSIAVKNSEGITERASQRTGEDCTNVGANFTPAASPEHGTHLTQARHGRYPKTLFLDCLTEIEHYWSRGVFLQDFGPENIIHCRGRTQFIDCDWAFSTGMIDRDRYTFFNDDETLRQRDLYQLGKVFAQIADPADGSLHAVIGLMTHPREENRITDLQQLRNLFSVALNSDTTSESSERMLLRRLLNELVIQQELVACLKQQHKQLSREHWEARIELSIADLCRVVPSNQIIALADGGAWSGFTVPGRITIPYPEQNGISGGQPASGEDAVAELRRLMELGARYVAFPEASYWWFDAYSELHEFVKLHAAAVLQNDRVQVFHLVPVTQLST